MDRMHSQEITKLCSVTVGTHQYTHNNNFIVAGMQGIVNFLLVEVGWWDLRGYSVCEKP